MMERVAGHRLCTTFAVMVLLLSAPFLGSLGALQGHGAVPRADEPVVFVDATNTSGLGWGSRSRVAWGDFNGDGWDDLLFRGRELWRNIGNGSFYDVTGASGISVPGSRGGVWGDYDNDGDLDIYQLHGTEGDDRLFRNNGDGTFSDMTVLAGEISDGGLPTEGAAWGDYDNDGFLDLYVANYEDPPSSGNGTYDVLYHNNGDGTFTNVTAQAGMLVEPQCGRGVSWADYDDDGFLDIYVANYRLNRNFLWHNNGDGTFTDVAGDLGIEGDLVLGYYGHSIGSVWGDVDNDGDLDLFVANLAHPRFIVFSDISKLYINTGPPDYNFQDRPIQTAGIAYEETHSDPSLMDYDNDGDLDLFITSVYEGRPTFLYRNDGAGSFTDVTTDAGTVTDNGWGEAWSDYDRDGFPDLSVGSGNGTKFKLFNNGGNSNNWLDIDLKGRTSNTFGIGARIELEANGTTYIREISGGRGTTSQDHLGAHFGLGDWGGVVNITVLWPSGIIQKQVQDQINWRTVLIEPDAVTDFKFERVTFDNRTVLEGENITLEVVVGNIGTVKGGASIELSVLGLGIVGSFPVIKDIPPFQNRTYFIEWNTTDMGGDRTIMLDIVEATPEEDNLTNNGWSHDFHINTRPVASIVSIDPPVAYQDRDMIKFDGDATDDGVITHSQWTSSLDGIISTEMDFMTEASNLTTGLHVISFKVRDVQGAWSADDVTTLMVEPPIPTQAPTARIIRVEPIEIKEDEPVEFEGEGTDPDGMVVGYLWGSSIDAFLSSERKFKTTELSVGDHEISFMVIDDDGVESARVTTRVLVKLANTAPQAVIDSIKPNPADEGEKVRFQGRGLDDEGQVTTFIWTSDMDGIISYDYNFVTTDLSVGTHTIGLKVKDSDGIWSTVVFESLEILPVNDIPVVTIVEKVDRSEDKIRLKGTSDDTDGKVLIVEVRVDNGQWQPSVSTSGNFAEWYRDLDLSDLEPGVYTVYARAFDGIDYSEEVHTEIEVEKDTFGDTVKWFMDALEGKNFPCLLVIVVIFVTLIAMVYVYSRGPEPEVPRIVKELEARRKKGKVKSKKRRGRRRKKVGKT